MDEYLLFGYHDNRPMNKYFLLIFAHFGLKTTTFLNGHKNYRCKDSTLKLNGMIALFIFNLKIYLIELKGKPGQSSVNRLLNTPSIVNPLPLKDIMEVDSL